MFYTGIRIGECAALNVDDVLLVGRKKIVIVRSGKNDNYREIPLNKDLVEALRIWVKDRKRRESTESEPAFFLNPQGRRISTAGIDAIVRKAGDVFSAN